MSAGQGPCRLAGAGQSDRGGCGGAVLATAPTTAAAGRRGPPGHPGVPGVTAAAALAAGPPPGSIAELERLSRLHESGALTDEEFAAAKAGALGI